MRRTIAAIPAAVAVSDLESMVEYAWCHLLVHRRRFVELVEQVTWWADKSRPNDTVRARVNVLRASAAVVSGRWVESGALNRQAMADLGESCWQDPLGRFAANGVARELALSERWDDTSDEVRQTEVALCRDPERRLAFEGTRALGEALAGRPLDALRVAAGVRRAAQVADMTIMRVELAVAEALAHRELGDRPRAVAELTALADAPAETMLFCRILAMSELAQAHLDEGALDTARHVFAQAETLVEEESLGADVRGWLSRVGTVLTVAAGDLDAARRWADQVDDPFWSGVSKARVHLALGDRPAAVVALEAAKPRCVRHDVTLALLTARAVADRDEAMKWATSAVEMASADGLLQTVASEAAEVIDLVEQAAWRAPEAVARSPATGHGGGTEPRRARRSRPDRAAHRARTRRPAIPPQPADHSRDRRRALHLGQHLEVPPPGHLSQARCELPCRSRRDRTQHDQAAPVDASIHTPTHQGGAYSLGPGDDDVRRATTRKETTSTCRVERPGRSTSSRERACNTRAPRAGNR